MTDIAYALMVMLGEIQNDINHGENTISQSEIDELYDMAVEIHDFFENND